MKKNFFTSRNIFVIAFSILVFIGLSISVYSEHNLANKYRHDLENTYKCALEELSEYTSSMEITLTKGLYANTFTQQHGLASKLLSESNGAKSAMSHLPIANMELDHIFKFVSQVGDFASYVSNKISSSQKVTREEMENIKKLAEFSKKANQNIKNLLEHFEDGSYNIIEFSNDVKNNVGQEPYINNGFKELNEVFVDYPTLIYDGPFSDHITQIEPKSINKQIEISDSECKRIASEFLSADESLLSKIGETQNRLPLFKFNTTENIEIGVTKNGGIVDYMINPRHIDTPNLNCQEAIQSAETFLREHGYVNMKESYYSSMNNICTINFAYVENGIICYSDLVKVGVALDNGEVVLFESSGYTMNHTLREVPKQIIEESKARQNVSPYLKIEKSEMAFSPTKGLNEVLCYGFKCRSEENEHVLVYINAITGMEEQIFIIKESERSNLVF